MLLLIAVAFLLKRYGTQAIPLPAPSPASASFEAPIFARDESSDGCNGRTVLDILWSCLATTFACTWVSVHPNVPFKGEGKWTLLRRRIFLMFFSILAPEFMIMWAFKQWRGAVMIRETVNKAILKASTNTPNQTPGPWTTTHGHFLQMGGFRLCATQRENFSFWKDQQQVLRSTTVERRRFRDNDMQIAWDHSADLIPKPLYYRHENLDGSWNTSYFPDNELTDNVWEGVLAVDALAKLLAENLITFPAITEDEINDRSKGDALSKGIALLQLTWFIVQIITRAVQGLAITELELSTAALAGLNSVMYIFWWSKPRDVRFPVVIRTKGVEELLAKRLPEDALWSFPGSRSKFNFRRHLCSSTSKSIRGKYNAARRFFGSFPKSAGRELSSFFEGVKAFPPIVHLYCSQVYQYCIKGVDALKGNETIEQKCCPREGQSNVLENSDEVCPEVLNHASDARSVLSVGNCTGMKINARTMIINGLKSTIKFAVLPIFPLTYVIDLLLFIPIEMISDSDLDNRPLSDIVGSGHALEAKTIFFMIFYSEDAGVKPLFGTASFAGALFGAVHCLAWHFSFPSHAEQILWRTASVGIVGSCVVTFQTVILFRKEADDIWEYVAAILAALGFLLCGLASFIYPVSRITLLVLAITSLRSLPSSAFDTVDWIEFVPHI